MSSREPSARARHAAVGVGDKLFVWGGSPILGTTATLESFNVSSLTWQQPQQLRGALPDGLSNTTVACEGEKFYSFGGYTSRSSGRINRVYEINSRTLLCSELLPKNPSNAPQRLDGSRSVYFKRKLVVYGGFTDKGRYIDELHVFDLDKRMWAEQKTSGDKPPPLYNHTFTMIDHHRAVVFGGFTGGSYLNATYVLDMETWHWTMLISTVQPSARYDHAAFCIAGPLTGQHHSLLMVVGGWGDEVEVLGDVWLLDVDKGVWSEVTLPVAITPRYGHSAVVFGSRANFKVVVVFGGRKSSHHEISETTLLLLELSRDSWQVTRVVKPHELGRLDESLKEQMEKLNLSSQEDGAMSHITNDISSHTFRGEGRAEVKDTDSVAITAGSTPTAVMFHLSDLHIGDKRLGKGGFGDVYEGHWKKREMTVAVKVTRSRGSAALPREIEVWRSLPRHRNIITLIGVASANFNTYIVMELAVNGSLFDYLHMEKKTPSDSQSLAWASDVANGMKHLHDYDIIHRDLKSANVLLTSEWVAKLCDFGSARELIHTISTEQTGTYRWMSPEVMRSAIARINKKCDLFSYGMILFELFAHKLPYADMHDNVEVLMSVINGKRPPIPLTLPSYLHDLLRSCWEEDPYLRPSFDDFVSKIVLSKNNE